MTSQHKACRHDIFARRNPAFHLGLVVFASFGVVAEAHVGARVVFGAGVRRLAGTAEPEIRRASCVAGCLAGLGRVPERGGRLRCEAEQSFPLLGLYRQHN